jgi:hypothetical protein
MEYMRDWFHSPLGLASPSVSLRSSPGVRGRSKGTGEINFDPRLLWPSTPRPDQLASLDKHDEFFALTMDCSGIRENRQGGPINFAPPRGKTFRPVTPESIHSFIAGSEKASNRMWAILKH